MILIDKLGVYACFRNIGRSIILLSTNLRFGHNSLCHLQCLILLPLVLRDIWFGLNFGRISSQVILYYHHCHQYFLFSNWNSWFTGSKNSFLFSRILVFTLIIKKDSIALKIFMKQGIHSKVGLTCKIKNINHLIAREGSKEKSLPPME